MGKLYELHGKDQRSIDASMWISRIDRGLTRSETNALRRWMAEDHRNVRRLQEMAELWDQMDAVACLAELFPHNIKDAQPKRNQWVAAATVALAAILIGLGYIGMISYDAKMGSEQFVATETGVFETPIGGISSTQLSDGSLLTLNTNSRVDVDFGADKRSIYLLRGEFHIDVAHDVKRPLRVHIGDRFVQAVGTAFTVRVDKDDRIELLVTDGEVRVGTVGIAGSGTNLLYTAGQRVVIGTTSQAPDILGAAEIENELSWRDGNLVFAGESLREVISEVSRYTTLKFVLLDEDLETVRVAGLYKAGDVSGFLTTLRANFDIAYEYSGDHTVLLSAPGGDAR